MQVIESIEDNTRDLAAETESSLRATIKAADEGGAVLHAEWKKGKARVTELEAALEDSERHRRRGALAVRIAQERITELEARLAAANGTIADLRDADKRAVKIAAEEANKQKAELEKQLADYEKAIDIDEAHLAKYRAENAKLICEVGELKARLAEAEADVRQKQEVIVEHEKAALRLLDEYDKAEADWVSRAETAEANAKVLAERLIETTEYAESLEHDVGVLLARAEAAEKERDEAGVDAQRYRAALEKVEWIHNYAECLICAWCSGYKVDGHKPDCARQAALSHGE